MLFDLSKQLAKDIQQLLSQSPDEQAMQSKLHSLVQSALRKCNLVTREEFDAQQAVLLKTREQLEQLEKRITELQQKL